MAYVADQIVKHLVERLNRTVKDVHAQPYMVKNQLLVFVNCLVENPAFDSQTKETLTTKPSAFGSKCLLSQAFLKDVEENTSIMNRVINSVRAKQHADLLEKSGGGQRRTRLLSIAKLEDANEAAGARAHECTLILTEVRPRLHAPSAHCCGQHRATRPKHSQWRVYLNWGEICLACFHFGGSS